MAKHLLLKMLTILGYQHKHRQGIKSMTERLVNIILVPRLATEDIHTKIRILSYFTCTDQMGHFLERSKSDNKFLMTLRNWNADPILGKQIPNHRSLVMKR